MSDEVANLLARKFIARPDVKARQFPGGYVPVEVGPDGEKKRLPWTRSDINDHLAGRATYGHYLLNTDDQCKLFVLDVDLEKSGEYDADFGNPNISDEDPFRWEKVEDLRAAWMDRAHPSRAYLKYQMHEIAHKLGKAIEDELEIPWAAAYSGGKGIHVYGFTGLMDAADVRDGALMVVEGIEEITPLRGQNFFKHGKYPNFSVEVFPKQASLDGKDLGNLCRLPLGKNLKNPKDPTFFLDMTAPMNVLAPLDPVYALTTTSQWKRPGE